MKLTKTTVGIVLTCAAGFLAAGTVSAQEIEAQAVVAPVKIDESDLSGLDIPSRQVDAHPGKDFYQKRVYRGEALSVFVLGGETMTNPQPDYPIDEFVLYMNGRAQIEASGEEISLVSGDYAVAPKGWSGTWTNHGAPLHNWELAVISTRRSEKPGIGVLPFRLDRNVVAGATAGELTDGFSRHVLYEGPELIVAVETEEVRTRPIAPTQPETFFHILSGSVVLAPDAGEPVQYFVGDNFVLPSGFSGEWRVQGRNGLRTIQVVAQEM